MSDREWTSPDGRIRLVQADCLDVLRAMPGNSVDAVVTDPPYGLRFMGKSWDADVPSVDIWREVLRVLKPGGHLLSFFGTRTYHRGAVAVEDAGFEIRDCLMWIYGSGFPKSLDVSKAIDKAAGAEREVVPARGGLHKNRNLNDDGWKNIQSDVATQWSDVPATDAAKQWAGWGTALKPAHEPVVVARKPLIGTVAENVLAHGTGGLNVDGCRVAGELPASFPKRRTPSDDYVLAAGFHKTAEETAAANPLGRWPANIIHDGSEEVVGLFPANAPSGSGNKSPRKHNENTVLGKGLGWSPNPSVGGDSGSAARFFYCAKASKSERGEGNKHPTVKPLTLMRYLCRLVTPPGGTVLDPFAGSGTTCKAAHQEGFASIGIERDEESWRTAVKRCESLFVAEGAA